MSLNDDFCSQLHRMYSILAAIKLRISKFMSRAVCVFQIGSIFKATKVNILRGVPFSYRLLAGSLLCSCTQIWGYSRFIR